MKKALVAGMGVTRNVSEGIGGILTAKSGRPTALTESTEVHGKHGRVRRLANGRRMFVRKGLSPDPARETVSELLGSGGTASRLDEPGFAGVCPMAYSGVTKAPSDPAR
jgi:hypothetical protein